MLEESSLHYLPLPPCPDFGNKLLHRFKFEPSIAKFVRFEISFIVYGLNNVTNVLFSLACVFIIEFYIVSFSKFSFTAVIQIINVCVTNLPV